MKVETKDITSIKKQITITLPKTRVEKELNTYFENLRNKVEMPGFRKGQVPANILRVKFSDQANTEVSAKLVYDAVNELMTNHSMKIVGSPSIVEAHRATAKRKYVGEFKLDGTFHCTLDMEIEPSLTTVSYSDLQVSDSVPNLDSWINDKIESFQYTFAKRTPVMDRKTKLGDEIVVDYATYHDNTIMEQGSVEFLTLTLQDNSGDLEKNFIDKPIKEEFEIKINYPTVYSNPALAGKSIVYKCFIHNAVAVEPHQPDDELAKLASYNSLDELKNDLVVRGERDYTGPIRAKLITEIMEQIIPKNQFEVPQAWIDSEMNIISQRLGLKALPAEPVALANLKDVAEKSIRQNFILDKIYENIKSIHLSAAELLALFTVEGKRYGMTAEKLIAALRTSNQYEGFVAFFEHNHTINFLLNSAKARI